MLFIDINKTTATAQIKLAPTGSGSKQTQAAHVSTLLERVRSIPECLFSRACADVEIHIA